MGPLLAALLMTHQASPPLRVAWLGCNRLEKKDYEKTKAENPSSANLVQLKQSLEDLDQLQPRPEVVFFTGDIVMGYEDDDGTILREQLNAWSKVVKASKLFQHSKIIAISGNHELNKKICDDRLPNPKTTSIWNEWIRREGFFEGVKLGPTAKEDVADGLIDDQRYLNGLMTVRDCAFVILNTDLTSTKQTASNPVVGLYPTTWFDGQLKALQSNSSIKHVFALGHRNVINESLTESPVEQNCADQFRASIRKSPKFEAYLCSHWHRWDLRTFFPKQWQVVEGRGGSKLDKDWEPAGGQTFGFSVLDVEGAKVKLLKYSRAVPPGKYNSTEAAPAKLEATFDLVP